MKLLFTSMAGNIVSRSLRSGVHQYWLEFEPDWKQQEEDEIGHGGFGRVFREANPKVVGELWAVKRVWKNHPALKISQIVREIATSAELTQQETEYFVKLFGWNEDDNNIYIAMEYIPLGDLEKNLTSGWSEEDAKAVTEQLLSGLAIMHSHHITHRDLKPRNLLLVRRQPVHVKIGDFGISKRVPPDSSTKLITQYFNEGYVAPEALNKGAYTCAVDLWSLGCIIYRIVMGKPLFEGYFDAFLVDDDEVAQRLMAVKLQLSSDGVDIMTRLIVKDVQRRLTVGEALEHTWLNLKLNGGSV